jgi:hypothetical protein
VLLNPDNISKNLYGSTRNTFIPPEKYNAHLPMTVFIIIAGVFVTKSPLSLSMVVYK